MRRDSSVTVWELTDLEDNGVDAGELGLLPVQILDGTLQQQDLWVLDVSIHLKT